jgi:hypothetical protein
MDRGSTFFLKTTLFIIALAVASICVFALLPAISSDQTGYYRPILIVMIVSVLPFYFGLFQAWRLLGLIDRNQAFSELSIGALENIKRSALVISAMYAAAMPYIYNAADLDDAPGVMAIGLIIVGAALVVAVFAAVLRRLLRSAIDMQSENELTV